jgi:hypothetical protein
MWPERWKDIYDDTMDEFERRGCCMANPDYIDAIAERYQILESQRALYKEAALSVATQEPLARLLALLCAVLTDKEHREDDLGQFALAFSTEEKPNVGRNMLPGLALLSQMPECYDTLCSRGLPEEYILQTMRQPEGTVGVFQQLHGGAPGFHLLHWFQRLIRGGLFRVGRLQIEPCAVFNGRAQVFQNKKGELIALGHERPTHASGIALGSAGAETAEGSWEANVEETELYWEGYPYDDRGLVLQELVRLEKGEWEKVLERNDPVVALHIPADGPLTPEAVQDSLQKIREFMRTYFSECPYKAFTCNSWLVNPEVTLMLGEDSNIGKFCRLFHPLTKKAPGTSVFSFVYHKNGPVPPEELPEGTRLERALKAYYQSGKILYEMYGFILHNAQSNV